MREGILLLLILFSQCISQNLNIEEDGFKIQKLVSIPYARSMVLSPGGVLFVSSFNKASLNDPTKQCCNQPVRAVVIDGSKVIKVVNVTEPLYVANGIAFFNGSLYVALIDRILRYDNVEKHLDGKPTNGSIVVGPEVLPPDSITVNQWRYIRFSPPPENKLYMSIGAPCNIPGQNISNCVNDSNQKLYGSIIRYLSLYIKSFKKP